MKITNIEGGLHKTMVAVFKKKGMSQAAAADKATKNLAGALATFTQAQAKSVTAKPFSRDAADRLRAKAGAAKAQAKAAIKVGNVAKFAKPSIKTSSSKITSAEQVALHKATSRSETRSFVAAKTSASVAIALGAVATWARKL